MSRILAAASAVVVFGLLPMSASADPGFGRAGVSHRQISHNYGRPFAGRSTHRLRSGSRRFPGFIVPVIPGGFGGGIAGRYARAQPAAFAAEQLSGFAVPAVAGIRPAPVGTPTIYVIETGPRRSATLRRRAAVPAPPEAGNDVAGPRVITAPRDLPPAGPRIVTVRVP